MSGHSKWATIKRQKGVTDAKRGQLFTKLSKAIAIAVKQGGNVSDINSNPRLRLAVDTAKSYNMPKDNIDRAIKRASGKEEKDLQEVLYEGFGPGGFSFMIDVITDNKQRTTPEIKNRIEKLGGTMGVLGSVSYLFEQKGLIIVSDDYKSLDEIFLIAVDAGAEDVEKVGEEYFIYTMRDDLARVKDYLVKNSLIVKSSEFTRIPLSYVQLTDRNSAEKAIRFVEDLEEHDDIQKIYANYDIEESIGRELF